MSQENVDLVRSIVEAWNSGDYSMMLESVDPDMVERQRLEAHLTGPIKAPLRLVSSSKTLAELRAVLRRHRGIHSRRRQRRLCSALAWPGQGQRR